MSVNDRKYVLNVQLNEEEIEEKFGENSLEPEMTDEMYKLVFKCFKYIVGQKIYSSGKFRTSKNQSHSLNVAVGSNNGHLYMLKKSFMYIHKPALHIPYTSVNHVEFHRFSYQTNLTSRSFDIQVAYGDKSRTFKNIEKGEFENLLRFVESKDIAVRNKPVRSSTRATGEEVDDFMKEDSDEDDSDYSNQSEDDESYHTGDEDEDSDASPSKRKASEGESAPKKRSKR